MCELTRSAAEHDPLGPGPPVRSENEELVSVGSREQDVVRGGALLALGRGDDPGLCGEANGLLKRLLRPVFAQIGHLYQPGAGDVGDGDEVQCRAGPGEDRRLSGRLGAAAASVDCAEDRGERGVRRIR